MGLGSKIRALREARGWTQGKLGELAGVEQATLSALEKRDSTRSVYFVPLCRALGVTFEQLRDMSLQDLLFSPPAVQAPAALKTAEPEPLILYGTPGDLQNQLLRLFDELTPPQQAQLLAELRTTVEANRAIAIHYAGRKMQHTENERIERTFGVPPAR